MNLMDTEIAYYVDNILKLPREEKKKYIEQVDRLVERLKAKIDSDSSFGVIKFLQAGSFRKGTALKPRAGNGIDVDVAVYLDTQDASTYDLDKLHSSIKKLLAAMYPQKHPNDFTVQPRTLGIVFHDSGLAMDLVPVIPEDDSCTFGLQPSSNGQPPIRTNIPGQLEFIRARKNNDSRYKSLVRLIKQWRNTKELKLGSFTIELLVAHLQDALAAAPTLQEGLVRSFLYIAQSELRSPIAFPENGTVLSFPDSPLVILDPVNKENNVASRMTDLERAEIVTAAQEAWELLTTARRNNNKGETLECWKAVFGRSFQIEE